MSAPAGFACRRQLAGDDGMRVVLEFGAIVGDNFRGIGNRDAHRQGGWPMKLTYAKATHDDAETLVQMRIAAMRESLERVGRFDPQRARARFLSSFDPACCRFIVANGVTAGFLLVRPADEYLMLEHLYILPAHQGRGIGSAVLASISADADSRALPVKVGALRGSDSNRFYLQHGFVKVAEAEWDIYYVRAPRGTRQQDAAPI